jgi:SET domain-containing protein
MVPMRIVIRETKNKGRGVFALTTFAPDELIEETPAIAIPAAQKELIARTSLADYPYDWADGGEALLMGYGSFYNHSYRPNARYVKNFARQTIDFISIRPIEPGEEITVNYNGTPEDQTALWFKSAESP